MADDEKQELPKKGARKRTGEPIGPPVSAPAAPAKEDDEAGRREDKETFDRADRIVLRQREKLRNERLRIGNAQRVWNNRMRLAAASGIFFVVLGWLLAVLIIIGVQNCPQAAKLSDSVMISLLVASSVNVIGLLRIVAVYLFPRPNSR